MTVMNCEITTGTENLVGVESLSQVFMHLTRLYERHGDVLPCDFGYDDGWSLEEVYRTAPRHKRPSLSVLEENGVVYIRR